MTGVWESIILFTILSSEGGAVRMIYSLILAFQKRWGNKFINIITDILFVVFCGGIFFATCFLLSNEIRAIYVLTFFLGIIISHISLSLLKAISLKYRKKHADEEPRKHQ